MSRKRRAYDSDTSEDDSYSDGIVIKKKRPCRQSSQPKRFMPLEGASFTEEETDPSVDDSYEDKSYTPQRRNPKIQGMYTS